MHHILHIYICTPDGISGDPSQSCLTITNLELAVAPHQTITYIKCPFGIGMRNGTYVQHRAATANVPISALCAFLRNASMLPIGVVDSSALGSSLITKRSNFSLNRVNTHVPTPHGELTYVLYICSSTLDVPTEYNLLSSRICEIIHTRSRTCTEYERTYLRYSVPNAELHM